MDQKMTVRRATTDDLDSLTNIACSACPMDPQWDYRFPRRDKYWEDHWRCTKEMYSQILKDPNNVTNVLCLKDAADGVIEERLVALAVWEIPGTRGSTFMSTNECEGRQDADTKRMRAFADTLAAAKKRYFDDQYGRDRIHLRILATDPKFQNRGAGTKHCTWGMNLAKERNLPVTLFSSPMGQKLYTHLGFILLGFVTVQVKGEDEKLSIGIMMLHIQDDEQRSLTVNMA